MAPLHPAPRFSSVGGAAPAPGDCPPPLSPGAFSQIVEARAKEYLAGMAYRRAQKRHTATERLRRAWIMAKAELAALDGRYGSQAAAHD